MPATTTFARALWTRVETIHAVTYFAPESREAARDAGLKGFWMGYFGFRAAPLGAVGPGVVEAACCNFAPSMVRRAIPDAWTRASPADLVAARTRAAATALRGASVDTPTIATAVLPRLQSALARAHGPGRALFAANAALAPRDDPTEALWQSCTCIREHRGDGHVAALLAAGLDGLEAHVLFAAAANVPVELLRDNRGWTDSEWQDASERLIRRRLLDSNGAITAAGRDLRTAVETTTDALAGTLFDDLGQAERDALLHDLDPLVDAVLATGIIPFPNPMGLPAPAAGA